MFGCGETRPAQPDAERARQNVFSAALAAYAQVLRSREYLVHTGLFCKSPRHDQPAIASA